uniref:Uncharacterized protein n=1 Tax=Arundo donax TaxID=35708 RepID=A0A0A9AAH5_ARUDO
MFPVFLSWMTSYTAGPLSWVAASKRDIRPCYSLVLYHLFYNSIVACHA